MQRTDFHVPSATENPMTAEENRKQLPHGRPVLEFPIVHPDHSTARHAGAVFVLIVGSSMAGAITYQLSRIPPDAGLYLLIAALAVAFAAFLSTVRSKLSVRVEYEAVASVVMAALLFCLVGHALHGFATFLPLLLIPVPLFEALRVRKHYIFRATAGMLDPKTIDEFRDHHRLPPGLRRRSTIRGFVDAVVSYLTYNHRHDRLPGTFQSPAGPYQFRVASSCLAVFLLAVASASPTAWTLLHGDRPYQVPFMFTPMLAGVGLWLAAIFLATFSFAGKAYALKYKQFSPALWPCLLKRIRTSPDPIERDSLFLSRVAYDGSPVLYPLNCFFRHAWIAGKTGSGKTAFLMMLIDQFIQRGDLSVIVVDLKAMTHEVLASMLNSAERLSKRVKAAVPVKHFTLDNGESSYLFNIFTQPWWRTLSVEQQAGCILSTLSLIYSRAYGQSYFTDSCYELILYVVSRWRDIKSWAELRDRIREAIRYAKEYELSSEVKRDAQHVLWIINRLANLSVLNAKGHPQAVLDAAIDFADALSSPRHYYFAVSAIRNSLIAGDAGRLVVAAALNAAAARPHAPIRLALVIDEINNMVTPSQLTLLLSQARGLGVAVILTNQTSAQLITPDGDLRPIVEGNTSMQAWMQITDVVGREQLQRLGGKHVIKLQSKTKTTQSDGNTSSSTTETEHIVDRVSDSLISRIGATRERFFLRLTDNEGYACYGDLMFAARFMYHQTRSAYKACMRMPWPAQTAATLISRGSPRSQQPPQRPAPVQPPQQPASSRPAPRARTRGPAGPRSQHQIP